MEIKCWIISFVEEVNKLGLLSNTLLIKNHFKNDLKIYAKN